MTCSSSDLSVFRILQIPDPSSEALQTSAYVAEEFEASLGNLLMRKHAPFLQSPA